MLAVTAAQGSTDLVAKLRSFYNEAQVTPERKNVKWIGLDGINGKPGDNQQAEVFEPTIVKVKSLKLATDLQQLPLFELRILLNYIQEAKMINTEITTVLFTQETLLTDLILLLFITL